MMEVVAARCGSRGGGGAGELTQTDAMHAAGACTRGKMGDHSAQTP
jgi:hypothetical protein